jgi:FkbM family methyltransferase
MIHLSLLAERIFYTLTAVINRNIRYSYTMPVKYFDSILMIRPFIFSEVAMVSGVWEPYVQSLIKREIKSSDVVVDVGANIGIYAIPLAKRIKKVIAFEPHPHTSEMLEKSIGLNKLQNLTLIKKAVSENEDKLVFNLTERPMESGIISSNDSYTTVEVESVDLDSALAEESKIDWVIIDVEGFEVSVLNGARNTLSKFHPDIIIEVKNLDKVKEILLSEGYSLTNLYYIYYYAKWNKHSVGIN